MKYFALNVECSRETFRNVAREVADFMINNNHKMYVVHRGNPYYNMPIYVDGHMTFACRASKKSYCGMSLEQMDEVIQIFDNHRSEYTTQEDCDTMIAWTGTNSKRGYLHWYRVTDEYFLFGDCMKCSVPNNESDAQNVIIDAMRNTTMSVLDIYYENISEAYAVFNSVLLEKLQNAEINLNKYELYGMNEYTAKAIVAKKLGKVVDIDYDMGCVYASFDKDEENDDDECDDEEYEDDEEEDEYDGSVLNETIASYLGVDKKRVYTFTNDSDQDFPDMIMVMVYPDNVEEDEE